MFDFSPQTRKRIKRFKSIRRGHYSLWILLIAFLLSLISEAFIGNRPVVLYYDGQLSFPAFTNDYYSDTMFGGSMDIAQDFRKLAEKESFEEKGWMIMPLHPYSPLESVIVKGDRPPAKPQLSHPFGTDDRGRDLVARIVYGFRVSMSFALLLTLASMILGSIAGALQGYLGGWFDLVCQRLIEVWQATPFLYVVLMVNSVISPNFVILIGLLMLWHWIPASRYVRAEVLRERGQDYVTASRSQGMSLPHILFREILPNSLTPIITITPFRLVLSIFVLTSLDFLGFGLPAPTPSWGELFKQARSHLSAYWLTLFPFAALFLTLLLTTFIGEAAREAWDPKQYQKRE